MKKSLIALAVLGLSSAAMAQSSVTLYGVADAGLGKVKSLANGPNDANNKTQFISGSLMNNLDSRVGVRGTEDLGGGLKAGFNFETGLDLDNGGTTTDAFWARQASMWVSGVWGTVKLGRQYTPSFLVTATYELTDLANYSVLANTYNVAGIGFRANSAFAYVTPSFNGLTAALAYVSKHDEGLSVVDVGAMYAAGPIAAGFSFNKSTNGKTSYQLGGKYDFGNFAVAASYTQASPLGSKKVRRGFGLGGSAKFGAFTATLDLTSDTKNEWDSKKRKRTNGVAELKYALSKRTFVYGAYLRLDKTNNYSIGVDHSF
ncbi:MAG: porin [Desulfovibrionaceae bacterium]|nr:porin [Desulfovibrionaceae bacterium]